MTDNSLQALILLFACVYVVLLSASVLFVDRGTPIDQRTLAPVFAAMLIIVIVLLTRLWRVSGENRVMRPALCALALYIGLAYTGAALAAWHYLHENGRGFTAKGWRYDRIFARLRDLNPDLRIYSNHPAAVLFLTGRHSREIPTRGGVLSLSNMWAAHRLDAGPSLILWFEDARKFTPRNPAAAKVRDVEKLDVRDLANRFGGSVLERERNAVLYRVERFPR